MDLRNRISGSILGLIIGDAIGVPYEFASRNTLKQKPALGMIGFRTHNQPPGTWSDDSSMTLITIESLCSGYNPDNIMKGFERWIYSDYMTPHGVVFDSGITTRQAIVDYHLNIKHIYDDVTTNGNGSLMRILPLSLYVANLEDEQILKMSFEISKLTHGHIRSMLCCCYFSFLIKELLQNNSSLENSIVAVSRKITPHIPKSELAIFSKILSGNILYEKEEKIKSSGYVIDSLEAAIWCCYHSDNYKSSVLSAVNLGGDTDTIAAITGAISGLIYGLNAIPVEWINSLVKKDSILTTIEPFIEIIMKRLKSL